MSKIVFVNPPLTVEERYGVKHQSGGQTPPLGLAYLSAVTRKHGFETEIIDATVYDSDYNKTSEKIIASSPDYVGITAAAIAIDNADQLARLIKSKMENITIIVGGPHMTAVPDETMQRYLSIDIGVIGEGEITIIDLLTALEEGRSLREIKGIIYRDGNHLFRIPTREYISHLDDLPYPAWDLLPEIKRWYCPPVHTIKNLPAMCLVTSRGCTGQCIFCDRSVFGNRCRAHSAEYVFKMIEDLYENYGIRELQIRDDNFLIFKKRAFELCSMLQKRKFKLSWSCAGRIDMVEPHLMKEMKKAGCWQIWYGIESGSQKVLDYLKKGTKIDQIKRNIHITKEAGISPAGFFMIGCPGETKEDIKKTIRFSQELELDDFHISFLTPHPGSELYDVAEKYGTLNKDWKKTSGWLPVYVPYDLRVEDLETMSKKAFRQFYFRPRVIISYILRIRTWGHVKAFISGFLALLEWLIVNKKKKLGVSRN